MTAPVFTARVPFTAPQIGAQYDPQQMRTALNGIARGIPPMVTRTTTVDTKIAATDDTLLVDTTSGNITITLLPANQVQFLRVQIKNIGANSVTISGTVDGLVSPVLAPSGVLVIQSDGIAWRQISPRFDGTYNVRDYYIPGITPSWNGAFNAAISAANGNGGGKVRVPAGAYTMAASATTLLSHVTLAGDGRESTTLTWDYAGGIGLYGSGINNASVEGLSIGGVLSMGVVYNLSQVVRIAHCAFSGCTSGAHATRYAFGCGAWVSDDVTIEDNRCSGNGYISAPGLSSDIQFGGNGLNTGSERIHIWRNTCLSTSVQTNIVAYDIQHSDISWNFCSGAKTGTGNNNGYGIATYRTVVNSGVMEDNAITNNIVASVGGSGVYVQSAWRTRANDNTIVDAGIVQDDTTLVVGGIAFSNCFDCTANGNVIILCGKGGVSIGGIVRGMLQLSGEPGGCEGFEVVGNTIDTVSGPGVNIRGPLWRSTVGPNSIKNCTRGIATLPSPAGRQFADGVTTNGSATVSSALAAFSPNDVGLPITGAGIPTNTFVVAWVSTSQVTMSAVATASATGVAMIAGGISGCTFAGNDIEAPTQQAFSLYAVARSTFVSNPIARTGASGIVLVYGYDNTIANNPIFDGGTLADNTYSGIDLSLQLYVNIWSNTVGNTGATGYKYGMSVPASCTGAVVEMNRGRGARTANFLVDAAHTFHGNTDSGSSYGTAFPVRQQIVVQGAAGAVTQLLLGDAGGSGAVGTKFTGGDTFMAENATHTIGSDLWHQSSSGSRSWLMVQTLNGDTAFYDAPNGTADADFATFWGTPIFSIGRVTSKLKLNGTQVVTTQRTGWNAPTTGGGALLRGTFDTGATLLQTAETLAAVITDLRTHGLLGT